MYERSAEHLSNSDIDHFFTLQPSLRHVDSKTILEKLLDHVINQDQQWL